MGPRDLRGHHTSGAAEDGRGGIPLYRRHDRQGYSLGAAAESTDGRQAILHVFRTGCLPCTAPRAQEWADKYEGKFDQGWDKLREEILARQKSLGVVPKNAELTARPKEIQVWDEVNPKMKPVLARQMEVYAGFLEHTDHHVGRLIDTLRDLQILDDTLIYVIIGDNGASAEGTPNGTFNEMLMLNGITGIETPEFLTERIDKFGSPEAYNHYAVGWAHAMDTPYQWTKQVASHWGGTRNGTIVHRPRGIKAKGEIRLQFCHVIDLAPTVLDVAGLPEPTIVNSVQQARMEGVSMAHSFDDAKATERHELQYFEMFCNRGIYHKGWSAVTRHSTPWVTTAKLPAFDDDVWELYDGSKDWTQARSGERDAGEAARTAAAMVDRGNQVQRVTDRRPQSRAFQC